MARPEYWADGGLTHQPREVIVIRNKSAILSLLLEIKIYSNLGYGVTKASAAVRQGGMGPITSRTTGMSEEFSPDRPPR